MTIDKVDRLQVPQVPTASFNLYSRATRTSTDALATVAAPTGGPIPFANGLLRRLR